MATNRIPQPLFYRAEVVEPLMEDLLAGECCSIIGTSGAGKSNLTKFLQQPDMQAHYLKDEPVWIVLIDSHSLSFPEQNLEFKIFELMVRRLKEAAKKAERDRGFSTEATTRIADCHNRLVQNQSTYLALQSLEDVCEELCDERGLKLIFVFDQFDDLWQTADAHFFLNLRSLRDKYKYLVVYLVLTRDRLERMRQDFQAAEAFWELFSPRATYSLGPFSEKDIYAQIERLLERFSIGGKPTMDDIAPELISKFSGGHPALLRAIFLAFSNPPRKSFTIDEVLQDASVRDECKKIWNTLSPVEQGVCKIIARKLPLALTARLVEALHELRFKELVLGDPAELFSPVFAAYVQQNEDTESNMSGIVVNVPLREVWLDGQLINQSLPPLEFKLIEYLARHVGTVCTHENLLQALYGDKHLGKNDQRLVAILARLRKDLGENAKDPQSRYIITHHGDGVQLLKGHIVSYES